MALEARYLLASGRINSGDAGDLGSCHESWLDQARTAGLPLERVIARARKGAAIMAASRPTLIAVMVRLPLPEG